MTQRVLTARRWISNPLITQHFVMGLEWLGMKFLDPDTESAVRKFLALIPADLKIERAILYGSRARGDARPDSDADLALIVANGGFGRTGQLRIS